MNRDNILVNVKDVNDWWSEGDEECRGGGLGYWLAISSVMRQHIQNKYADPIKQKEKLIDLWLELDVFTSWHWLNRAVQRVGHTQMDSTLFQQPAGIYYIILNTIHVQIYMKIQQFSCIQLYLLYIKYYGPVAAQ